MIAGRRARARRRRRGRGDGARVSARRPARRGARRLALRLEGGRAGRGGAGGASAPARRRALRRRSSKPSPRARRRRSRPSSELVRPLGGPLAVRSSAVDEDGAEASFAGQHLTLLNVPSADEVGRRALREVWWSANSDSAITYRQRVGLVHAAERRRRRPGAARSGQRRRDVHAEPGQRAPTSG